MENENLPIPSGRMMRVGYDRDALNGDTRCQPQASRDPDRHALAVQLLGRLDRMMPAWQRRLQDRATGVLRGDEPASDAERAQQADDAELVALRRLAERLQRAAPLV